MYSSYGGRAGAAGLAGGGGGYGGVGVGPGEECTACGVGCGGSAGNGALSYVGSGQGEYVQETTYKYVGHGGDFDVARPRRDFTCIITGCCLLSLLLLIPLLCWLLSGTSTSQPYDCAVLGDAGMAEAMWSQAQKDYCCMTMGRGCSTTALPIIPATMPATVPPPPPTQPPPPPATPGGPVDPFNCAVDPENTWKADKKAWCCRIHHRGCPPTAAPMPVPQPVPSHSSSDAR